MRPFFGAGNLFINLNEYYLYAVYITLKIDDPIIYFIMKTALLLIDIQNDYFENGRMSLEGSEAASLNARLILEKFRINNGEIIHIQHIATRPGSTFFLPDTKGCEIHPNVFPKKEEKVIVKHSPNSFQQTELLAYLKERDITALVICGMMTHMCVDATTRAAKDFGFTCTVISDACATRNLELKGRIIEASEVHYSFLAALNGFYSTVETTPEYLEKQGN